MGGWLLGVGDAVVDVARRRARRGGIWGFGGLVCLGFEGGERSTVDWSCILECGRLVDGFDEKMMLSMK